MKKIVPFNKDILFENTLAQISSIALDHNLKLKDKNLISGEFKITGTYKMTSASLTTDNFEYNLPFDISIDKKYNTSDITIDINDFYYEIKDDKILSIDIEIVIGGLKEIEKVRETKLEENIINNITEENKAEEENIKSVFSDLDNNERYVTYKVHVVKENDTILSISEKYGVTKEELEKYNDLNNLNIFDKIIIPSNET